MEKCISKLAYFLIGFCGLVFSCTSEDVNVEKEEMRTELWTVGSKAIQLDYGTCFWIKVGDNPVWELLSSPIEDFDYQEGYEYNIEVKVKKISNPPLDASSLQYSLIKILSQTKKESDVPLLTKDLSECINEIEIALPDVLKEEVKLSGNSGIQKSGSFYILQGDILLSADQVSAANTRSGCITDKTKYWPNNVVYYTFAKDFTFQSNVLSAIREWETKTSLTFVNSTGRGNYIEFFHGPGNYSYLGMQGGKQELSLSYYSNVGTAIHEIGHAIGLIHEQCRNDRDRYINIYPENVEEGKLHNFNIYSAGSTVDIGTFDFGSIMLYSSNAFSKNGKFTMTTKDGLYFVGQRNNLSSGDVEGICAIYGPPFHKLNGSIDIIREEVSGLNDIIEYEMTYTINIYEDKGCTKAATLKYPRNITVYIDRRVYNTNNNKLESSLETRNIVIPIGVSSYTLGTVHNIEWYIMSNPREVNTTSYSIAPQRTILQ